MARRMLLLHGLAALMIPFHHGTAYGLAAMFTWAGGQFSNQAYLNSWEFWTTMLIRQVDSFAIPAFLLISGFFIAFSIQRKSFPSGVKITLTRIRPLLIQFVIWTGVHFTLLGRLPQSMLEFFSQYYYLILLSQLFLLAPFLVIWAKKNPRAVLITTGLVQLIVLGARYVKILGISFPGLELLITLTPLWFFPSRIFYFAFGLVAGVYLKDVTDWLKRHRRLLVTVMFTGLIVGIVEFYYIVALPGKTSVLGNFTGWGRLAYAMSAILVFLASEDIKIPWARHLEDLGSHTLGIYFLNTPTIYVVSTLLFQFVPGVFGIQWLYQLILFITGLYIPLFILWVFRQTPLRVAYRTLFG